VCVNLTTAPRACRYFSTGIRPRVFPWWHFVSASYSIASHGATERGPRSPLAETAREEGIPLSRKKKKGARGTEPPPRSEVEVGRTIISAAAQVIIREFLDALLRWIGRGGLF
jgi:hypothetical protein